MSFKRLYKLRGLRLFALRVHLQRRFTSLRERQNALSKWQIPGAPDRVCGANARLGRRVVRLRVRCGDVPGFDGLVQ